MADETQGQDSSPSLIRPIIYPCSAKSLQELMYLATFLETRRTARDANRRQIVKLMLEYKLDDETRPELPEKVQTDKTIKALWYQCDSLETKNGLPHRKWRDNQGCTIYQLVAPDVIKKTIFDNFYSHFTPGHLGRDRTLESIKCRFY